MMRTYNIEKNLQEPEQRITVEFGEDRLLSILPNTTTTAFNVRELYKTYFQTSTGRVSWQNRSF